MGRAAKALAESDAAGDGEHVFDRAANLRAEQISGQIRAESRCRNGLDQLGADGLVLHCQRHGRWQALGDIDGEAGA